MADEFTLTKTQSPVLEFISGTLGAYGQGLTSNWGDEITAQLLAPSTARQMAATRAGIEPSMWNIPEQRQAMTDPRYYKPEDYDTAVKLQLDAIRQQQAEFDKKHPVVSTLANLGGTINQALLGGAALKTVGGKAAAALPKLAKAVESISPAGIVGRGIVGALTGAAGGSLQGFASGAGEAQGTMENRMLRGADVAIGAAPFSAIAGALSSAIQTPEKLSKLGRAEKRASLGVTKADYKKSMSNVVGEQTYQATGESQLGQTLTRLEDKGIIDISMIKAPSQFKQKTDKIASTTAKELTEVIKQADEVGKVAPMTFDDFTNVRDYASTGVGSGLKLRQAAVKREMETVLESQERLPKTLAEAQKLKTDIYKEISAHYEKAAPTAANNAKAEALRNMAKDVRSYIEKSVDNLADAGSLPTEYKGVVRSLNEQIGDIKTLEPFVAGLQAAKESSALSKMMTMATRTTMGGGAPMIMGSLLGSSGSIVGAPLAAAGALLGLTSASPTAQYRVGQGIETIARALQRLPQGSISGKLGADISSRMTETGLTPRG